jgi:predicted kinase
MSARRDRIAGKDCLLRLAPKPFPNKTPSMELLLFIGIQATGKSTFYRAHFADTHLRINLDMLKTRHREKLLFDACLAAKAPFVVDNTNLTRAARARYLAPARTAQFRIHGYFFESRLADALQRNASRDAAARIPDLALKSASRQLQLPALEEGFDSLHFVRITPDNSFVISPWTTNFAS